MLSIVMAWQCRLTRKWFDRVFTVIIWWKCDMRMSYAIQNITRVFVSAVTCRMIQRQNVFTPVLGQEVSGSSGIGSMNNQNIGSMNKKNTGSNEPDGLPIYVYRKVRRIQLNFELIQFLPYQLRNNFVVKCQCH